MRRLPDSFNTQPRTSREQRGLETFPRADWSARGWLCILAQHCAMSPPRLQNGVGNSLAVAPWFAASLIMGSRGDLGERLFPDPVQLMGQLPGTIEQS